MSSTAGDIGQTSAELAGDVTSRRFLAPADADTSLRIDERGAGRKLARRAGSGWLRRLRLGRYLTVPGDVDHPDVCSEDALVDPSVIWERCYFTGW